MAPSTLERQRGAWLIDHAEAWVEAGLISPGQASAIEQFERADEPPVPQRLPISAEVASYLGSVLAMMGGAVVVGQRWDDLALFGRLGIAAVIAVVGFVAGAWLLRLGEVGASRLGSYLWVLGTGGVAMAAAVIVDEVDSRPEGWLPLIVGLPVLSIGLLLWRNLERPLQFLTGAVGAGFSLGGIAELTELEVWAGGLVLIGVGAAFAVGAAMRVLQPHLVVLATGSSTAFIGAFLLGDYNDHLGPAVALLVAATVVVLALRQRLVPLLVLGVVASLIATQSLLATTFTGAVSSSVVALLGVAVVVASIVRTRQTPGAHGI